MFENARLDIYESLTLIDGEQPELLFSVEPDDLIDWDISAKQGAADNISEIYGRTATITLLKEGDFGNLIANKLKNAIYPEYYDAAFQLVNTDSGASIFTGALRLEDIKHNYDNNSMTITLRDSLDIWITQARKFGYTFSEGDSSWKIDGEGNNLQKLMTEPVAQLALNMNQYVNDAVGSLGMYIQDLQITLEDHNELYGWQLPYITGSYTNLWQGFYTHIYYQTDSFYVLFLHTFRWGGANNWLFQYQMERFLFHPDNLLQPYSKQAFISNPRTSDGFNYDIASLLGDTGASITWATDNNNYPYIIVNGVHSVTVTINDNDYKMEIEKVGEQDKLYVSTPLDFNEIEFSDGTKTYETIFNVLLTANILHIRANEIGIKHINYSVLNPNFIIEDGTIIPDDDIVNQTRDGALLDVNTIASILNNAANGDNIANAIKYIYRIAFTAISCKLSFSLPDYYYNEEYMEIFKTIQIDDYNYILTNIGYPKDGLIEIECLGSWN
jgi:hypothetical protein